MPKKNNLLSLIEEAKTKDREAHTKLINTLWIDVFSFVMQKVKDKNITDDITVRVFSKTLAKLDSYNPDFSFKTWILTIAQNTIIDFHRKQNLNNETSTENMSVLKNHLERSPEELMISQEKQQEIIQTIEALDEKYKKIIRLRFFEELSIKEIADKLGISVSNTKVRIMRAKKLLAELLKNNYY